MFETFDHTADLGLRVRTKDLDCLFREAAEALISILVENTATIEPRVKLELHLESDDLAYLLFDWLREILYRFDGESDLLGRFDVHVIGTTLTATAWSEPVDRTKHVLAHEVKAITYHGLRVEQTDDGWLAEVIVDI
jgi:SHS2 domain-containing protein